MAAPPSTAAQVAHNERSARLLLAALGAVVTLVVLVVLALLVPLWLAVVVALAGGVLAALVVRSRAHTSVLRSTGASVAGATEHARLHNLVEGLCASAGVPKPGIFVVDDAAPNALVVGLGPRQASIVLSAGLESLANRVELEGVLAHLLSRIQSGDVGVATLAAVVLRGWEPGMRRLLGDDRVSRADFAAVELTRYPPGLFGALRKLEAAPTTALAAASPATAHLHLVSPLASGRSWAHPPLADRIAALGEL